MKSTWARGTATFLALIGLLTNAVLAAPAEANLWKERRAGLREKAQLARLPSNPPTPSPLSAIKSHQLSVPQALGTVKGGATPPQERLRVLHVQDLHLHEEAQKNIGAAVASLLET